MQEGFRPLKGSQNSSFYIILNVNKNANKYGSTKVITNYYNREIFKIWTTQEIVFESLTLQC